MSKEHNNDPHREKDYCGRILKEKFSETLKKKVADYIILFQKLNSPANPTIPYISAWTEDSNNIWYEFAGNRLLDLLNCNICDAAQIFGECVTTRCSFGYQAEEALVREILKVDEIKAIRRNSDGKAGKRELSKQYISLPCLPENLSGSKIRPLLNIMIRTMFAFLWGP